MKKLYSSFLILSLLSCFSAKAEIITIDQSGTTFSPNAINVNVGDVIHFVWSGGTHNTTSVTVPAGAATWASPLTMANPTLTIQWKWLVSMGMYAPFTHQIWLEVL
ncbi:MAG: hypothetical protein IPP69_03500 [Flavobacteriales bacterium]|nr:hypothetical protein [Flavobacteriales bacterium]